VARERAPLWPAYLTANPLLDDGSGPMMTPAKRKRRERFLLDGIKLFVAERRELAS
jgi:hypothetical protein